MMPFFEMELEKPHDALRYWDKYSFECQRCGECCTRPGYFTPEGLERAAAEFGVGKKEFFDYYCRLGPFDTVVRPRLLDGYCTFLKDSEEGVKTCLYRRASTTMRKVPACSSTRIPNSA
jgi:Fe-S-cluster containining protein